MRRISELLSGTASRRANLVTPHQSPSGSTFLRRRPRRRRRRRPLARSVIQSVTANARRPITTLHAVVPRQLRRTRCSRLDAYDRCTAATSRGRHSLGRDASVVSSCRLHLPYSTWNILPPIHPFAISPASGRDPRSREKHSNTPLDDQRRLAPRRGSPIRLACTAYRVRRQQKKKCRRERAS